MATAARATASPARSINVSTGSTAAASSRADSSGVITGFMRRSRLECYLPKLSRFSFFVQRNDPWSMSRHWPTAQVRYART